MYNYYEEMKKDVKEYLEENKEYLEGKSYDDIYDELFIADSVTGNASGSYTFNTWQAEENIAHNHELLKEAQECFGYLPIACTCKGAEWSDVLIRCYLLGDVLSEVLGNE